MNEFPDEVLHRIGSYLHGYDVIKLSHVCSKTLQTLSDPDQWTHRVFPPPNYIGDRLKFHYTQERSFQFDPAGDRGSCVVMDARPQCSDAFGNDNFSLDVWFAPMAGPNGQMHGGIILGGQSDAYDVDRWPGNHQQLVHVGPDGALYCSVVNIPKHALATLEAGRWYHLALTFSNGEQNVYLDGELIDHVAGTTLHREWFWLNHLQVGTGCISGDSVGKPTPDHCGWYGFQGLIDDLRIWRDKVLTADEVRSLYTSDHTTLREALAGMCYSLRDHGTLRTMNTPGFRKLHPGRTHKINRVRATRPLERVAETFA
ncbi:TPA: hypothetical protein N0F65_003728 [Lagenidium giganteum]|uniref:F-box domain-containing protein n=1 Tax=Lagenidium giganteum TaxID=4803 RepID=A0AAV2Z2T2_9STRA|nr:TPA: hypothetical protein N0F65_003728 [Lagenidium giganteum]